MKSSYFESIIGGRLGDGPTILGTACLFVFAHVQYLIPNAYNIKMVKSLFCLAMGLGIVFAYTNSLIPSMIAHALINIPMTPNGTLATFIVFVVGLLCAFSEGVAAIKKVFSSRARGPYVLLALIGMGYIIAA